MAGSVFKPGSLCQHPCRQSLHHPASGQERFVSIHVHVLICTSMGLYKIIPEAAGNIWEEQIQPPHCALKEGGKSSISCHLEENLVMLEIKVLPDTRLNTQEIKRGPASSQTEQTRVPMPAASVTKGKWTHPLQACCSLARSLLV